MVAMLNLGDVRAPAATVTVAGTVAAEFELDNVKGTPPLGAAAFKVTLACTVAPPTMLACPSVTEDGARGITVRLTGGAATPL